MADADQAGHASAAALVHGNFLLVESHCFTAGWIDGVFFPSDDGLAGAENRLFVGVILLGEFGRKEVEIGPSDHFRQRGRCPAPASQGAQVGGVGRHETAVEVLDEDVIGQVVDQVRSRLCCRASCLLDPPMLGDVGKDTVQAEGSVSRFPAHALTVHAAKRVTPSGQTTRYSPLAGMSGTGAGPGLPASAASLRGGRRRPSGRGRRGRTPAAGR